MTTGPVSEFAHARAPGKVNVFLKVGAVLDDGYHEVASAYQALSLYEDVRAYPADDFSVSFVGGSVDVDNVPTDASNLAIKGSSISLDLYMSGTLPSHIIDLPSL